MAPTVEGEFRRKRRMMIRALGRRASAGGCSTRAATAAVRASRSISHRLLRYLTPFLHLVALGANIALLGDGWVYIVTLARSSSRCCVGRAARPRSCRARRSGSPATT